MKILVSIILFFALITSALAQTCQSAARVRVTEITINVCSWGDDTNDGVITPLKTLQWGLDCAVSNFDFARRPGIWKYDPSVEHKLGIVANTAYRQGPIVKLCHGNIAPDGPIIFDGLGQTAPVWLQGDCNELFAVNIVVNNQFQGITAQDNGVLIIECLMLTAGVGNTTLVNGLVHGRIGVGKRVVFYSPNPNARAHAVGASALSSVDFIGETWFYGYFGSMFEVVQLARMSMGQYPMNLSVNWSNALYVLGALSVMTTEGSGPQLYVGSGSGPCLVINRNSVFDFFIGSPPCDGIYIGAASWIVGGNASLYIFGFDGVWH